MKDLFGNEITPPVEGKERIAVQQHKALISIYGKSDGNKCKNCKHLYYMSFSKTYYKCGKAKQSHSTATDWRVNWQACGLFEK